jgi:elongation factor P
MRLDLSSRGKGMGQHGLAKICLLSRCELLLSPVLVAVAPSDNQLIVREIMATANDLRRGMAINYNGDISVVLDSQHRTPGNLRAFVQATLRSIRSGRSSDVRFSSTEKIEVVPMMTRKMDFSYKDGEDYVFSDPENYETVTLSPEIVGDAKNYLVENASVTVTFVEDKAVALELPSSVVLKVADAPEGVRGDSANNVQKAITLETGITVQAPLFIKTGEKIKVDTRTGKYMERA